MEHIEVLIKEYECKEAYPFEFDVAEYKSDFASLIATLEEALEKIGEMKCGQEVVNRKEST